MAELRVGFAVTVTAFIPIQDGRGEAAKAEDAAYGLADAVAKLGGEHVADLDVTVTQTRKRIGGDAEGEPEGDSEPEGEPELPDPPAKRGRAKSDDSAADRRAAGGSA